VSWLRFISVLLLIEKVPLETPATPGDRVNWVSVAAGRVLVLLIRIVKAIHPVIFFILNFFIPVTD